MLQELAALPQRFLFFDVMDLAPRLARVAATEVDLVIPFSRAEAGLDALIDAASVSLNCTPAINLFAKRLDRIQITSGVHEFHAVPDRARPMDFEVHSIASLTGYGTAQGGAQEFLPLYAAHHTEAAQHGAYFTVRRTPRLLSQKQSLQGTRSAYVGSEVFLSLVDPPRRTICRRAAPDRSAGAGDAARPAQPLARHAERRDQRRQHRVGHRRRAGHRSRRVPARPPRARWRAARRATTAGR